MPGVEMEKENPDESKRNPDGPNSKHFCEHGVFGVSSTSENSHNNDHVDALDWEQNCIDGKTVDCHLPYPFRDIEEGGEQRGKEELKDTHGEAHQEGCGDKPFRIEQGKVSLFFPYLDPDHN